MLRFLFLGILALKLGEQGRVNAFQGPVEIASAGRTSHVDEDAVMNVVARKVDTIGMPVDCHDGHCTDPNLKGHTSNLETGHSSSAEKKTTRNLEKPARSLTGFSSVKPSSGLSPIPPSTLGQSPAIKKKALKIQNPPVNLRQTSKKLKRKRRCRPRHRRHRN
ncbi:hypothetical protein E2C01_096707 [Portunus trituberculatus]|uniref:Uncharacterized protein n=1 Tax=Portunus trituberculatus TaxID=210409 RepID=A0A5B7K7Y5_PORTR|nr:hypothetical protein [Portunus trituberculatus]